MFLEPKALRPRTTVTLCRKHSFSSTTTMLRSGNSREKSERSSPWQRRWRPNTVRKTSHCALSRLGKLPRNMPMTCATSSRNCASLKISLPQGHVRSWPEGEDRDRLRRVSNRGQTGHSCHTPKSTRMTHKGHRLRLLRCQCGHRAKAITELMEGHREAGSGTGRIRARRNCSAELPG